MGSSPDSSKTSTFFDIDINLIFVGAFFSLGRMGLDAFILTVKCQDWMKTKRLSPTDKILTFQSGIRICLGCMATMWFILSQFCPWIIQTGYVGKMFLFGFSYCTSCNVWLTTSLCSYYCVKIADFRHPFFIHLKLRLSSGLVSSWLLGSAILSLASSLSLAISDLEVQGNGNFSNFQNKNESDISHTTMALRLLHALRELVYCTAFSICATSTVLLLFSLWRHRQRMLGSWDGHRSPQDDAHFRAVITILSLLINHVLIFVNVQLFLSKDLEVNWIARLGAAAGFYICFLVESLIAIWGNKKLKNQLCKCLHFAKCKRCVS